MRVRHLTPFLTLTLLLLGLAWLATPALAKPAPKVEICHIPPGDPEDFHTITISENASAAHQAHGDLAGACEAAPTCPATGQERCWDGFGALIECADTGQDGEIRAGALLSYEDNGDGTITDLNTGLMWEKKSDDGGLHDKGNTYPWWSTTVDAIWDWLDDVNAEGGTGFAGYSDWRIPNVKELHSLSDYERRAPSIDPVFNTGCGGGCTVTTCSCTAASSTWSATTIPVFTNRAVTVNFTDGSVSSDITFASNRKRLLSLHVRAVRGGL